MLVDPKLGLTNNIMLVEPNLVYPIKLSFTFLISNSENLKKISWEISRGSTRFW